MLVVARVPLVEVDAEEYRYRRPVLPAAFDVGHGWGQAASEGRGTSAGEVLAWCRGDGAAVDALAAQPRSTVLRVVAGDADSARLVSGLRAADAGARREFWAAFREPAREEEERLRQAGAARVEALVLAVGAAAAAALLARRVGWPAAVALVAAAILALGLPVSWQAYREDTFDRANGALDNSVFSDGLGRWQETDPDLLSTILSNQAQLTDPTVVYDENMPDTTTDQWIEAICANYTSDANNHGVIARWKPASGSLPTNSTCYRGNRVGSGIRLLRLEKVVNGSVTQLGSNGSTANPQNASRTGVRCVDTGGTTEVTLTYNEADEVGPIADSAIAAGRGGIWATGTTNRLFNDYRARIPSPAVDLDGPGGGTAPAVSGVGVAAVAGPGGGAAADIGAFVPLTLEAPGGGTAGEAVLVAVAVPGAPAGAEPAAHAVVAVLAAADAGPDGGATDVQVLAAVFADAVPGGSAPALVAVAVAVPPVPGPGAAADAAFVAVSAAEAAPETGGATALALVALAGPEAPTAGAAGDAAFVAVAHVVGTTGGAALAPGAVALVTLDPLAGGGLAPVTVLAAVFLLPSDPGAAFEPYVLVPATGLPGNRLRARLGGVPAVAFPRPRARVVVLGEA